MTSRPVGSASADAAWDAGAVVARALRTDADAGRRVLKRGRRTTVVWLDAAGPDGEAVVVKYMPLRSWRERLDARLRGAPGVVQQRSAAALRHAGIDVPEPLAVVQEAGEGAASTLVMRAVLEAHTLKETYLGLPRGERTRFARALGTFVAHLHAAGAYVPDMKESNVLVRRSDGAFTFVLVDLDRVRFPPAGVSARRRLANVVHLDRSLGCHTAERERLAFLAAYQRAIGGARRRLSELARVADAAKRRKDASVARRRRRAGIKPDDRLPVSCIVICGNEVHRIRDCLDSVAWCDELIVVDSYSTDGTWDIVQRYTPHAARRAWTGHVDQKQYALDHARHRWVLNVDADECVSPGLKDEIEDVLAHDGRGYDGFLVPRVVHYLGRWWWRGGWYPDRRLRLFRRELAVWGGVDPHEKVILRGRVGRLRKPLFHFTYDDVSDHVRTIDRFTTTAANGVARPRRATWSQLVLRPLGRFLRFWILGRGFTMGFPGLFVALSAAFYVHLKYAKRDERATRGEDA